MEESVTPEGWTEVTLGEVAEVRLGRQRSPKNHTGDHMRPYLRAANVTWAGLDLSDVREMNFEPAEAQVYELRAGDVLMSEASGSIGEAGKPAIWREEIAGCCIQNTLIRLRPSDIITPEFLYYTLLFQARSGGWTKGIARGVGIHHLGAQRVAGWSFPLPPLGLQQRIVKDVERRLSRIHAGVGNLKRAQRRLATAEQAILIAGTTGRLIPRVPEDQDVEVLLKELLGEEAASGEATLELAGLPEIPAHWRWVSLGSIASVVGGVTKDSKRQADPSFVEVPYLRVANVQRGRLALADVATIRVPPAKAEALELQPGDVLFNEGGDRDKLGRGWVWEDQIPRCIHQNHVFRARLNSADISPRLLSWYGNSAARAWFEAAGKQTTNLASINLATLKSLPVPIAPREEQRMIESELERRLSLFRAAEAEIEKSLRKAQSLESSILHNAVTGRLGRSDQP